MIMTEKPNHATDLTDLTQLGHYLWLEIKKQFQTCQDKDYIPTCKYSSRKQVYRGECEIFFLLSTLSVVNSLKKNVQKEVSLISIDYINRGSVHIGKRISTSVHTWTEIDFHYLCDFFLYVFLKMFMGFGKLTWVFEKARGGGVKSQN